MSQAPKRIEVSENYARNLTLAQAVETSDVDGKLLSQVEREAIDSQVMQSSRLGADNTPARVEAFLCARAEQVLRVVGNRSPALAALAQGRSGAQWLAVAAPLAAVLIGAATDRIANPHRVDLLSLPLLALLLPLLALLGWNLAVYAALMAGWFWRRSAPARPPAHERASPFADLTRRFSAWHPRQGALQARVMALYSRSWYAATSALQAQRVRKVLHLAAAAWALGVVLSLFTRGLVVEYRVGWESTFLSAEQVHALLQVLLLPALSVFPFDAFSVSDIAALRFLETSANAGGAAAGARWVYLYASLLALVVIAPRLVLALAARWREARLARRIAVSLDAPYYRRLLALANPTRIRLGLMAQNEDDHKALVRILMPRADELDLGFEPTHGPALTVIRAASGESLGALRITGASRSAAGHTPPAFAEPAYSRPAWATQALTRFRREAVPAEAKPAGPSAPAAADDADATLQLVHSEGELQAALPLLRQLGQPAVLLLNADSDDPAAREAELARCRSTVTSSGLDAEVLDLASVARCWVQQPVLFDAIGRCLPAAKKEGFTRLLAARRLRNRERLARAMEAVANQLLEGAREVEAVRGASPSVTRLIKTADREADALARRQASGALVERLQTSALHTQETLLRLHSLDDTPDTPGAPLDSSFTAGFDHTTPVNTREAGMAGAATGAATGVSVDLITGGLTLGAAAALGALVGGGAALAGAAWKNRSSPTGSATVQLSDDMLHALVQIALLRYLAIVHLEGRALLPASIDQADQWPIHTAAVVAQHTDKLGGFWADARNPAAPHAGETLGRELEAIMRELLHALYPAAPRV